MPASCFITCPLLLRKNLKGTRIHENMILSHILYGVLSSETDSLLTDPNVIQTVLAYYPVPSIDEKVERICCKMYAFNNLQLDSVGKEKAAVTEALPLRLGFIPIPLSRP